MTYNDDLNCIYYSEDGSFIEYFYIKVIPPYYADVLDKYITLLRNQEDDRIIGIQIKYENVKSLKKQAEKETKEWLKNIKNIDINKIFQGDK